MNFLKSRIIIGTVQFGLPYGVSNANGQTLNSDAKDILNFASNIGINYIDTASSYGDSEALLGDIANGNEWKIITKIPAINTQNNHYKSHIIKSFTESLKKLRRSSIDSLLVHSCDDLFKEKGEELFETMVKLKDENKINRIGVSVYNEEQILRLLDKYQVDIIQLPISIFDQRLINSGYLSEIKSRGIEIHARSIFLQGLLFMDDSSLPTFFHPIRGKLNKLNKIAKHLSIRPVDLALSFVLNIKELDHILIGLNNLEQLKEIDKAKIIETHVKDYQDIAIFDERFINPSNWLI